MEDNPDHAEMVRVMLAHARGPRWGVTAVETLAEAKAWLKQNKADVVLLDLNLPDSRGPHTAGLLCREYPELPVVIFTSLTDESVSLDAMEQGAQDYLIKGQFEGVLLGRTLRLAIERKRAELAHARLAAIVDSSDDAIIGASLDGVILDWNVGAVKVYGYAVAEAVGRSMDILANPDRPHEIREIVTRVRRGEHIEPVETALRRKDGRLLDVSLAASPVRDPADRLSGVSVIARDITDLKRSRETLQEREERFRLLFELNPQPMWVFDWESRRFLEINEAAVRHYGYSRQEFVGMRLSDIFASDEVARLDKHLEGQRLASFHTTTWRQVKKDGSVIDVEATGQDMSFAGRRARLVVVHDVTERNQLQAQLLQSQKMEAIGRLAGGIAHDFNNLLGVITGYMALLKRDLPEGRCQRRAEEVVKAADRATSLTHQLLAFSRKQVLQAKVLNLNGVVGHMETMLRRLVGEDVQVGTVFDEGLGQVRADPSQIEQVLLNLVVNARDAMPQGGRLLIETANVDLDGSYEATHCDVESGRYVMLAVSDTGVGMTPEVTARIFEPFFTTKESGKGTGLGLATVYGIVKQSGGQIFVYSERGHGTTFKVYFRRTDSPSDALGAVDERPAAGGTETILLVEDDGSLRDVIREMLEEKGYTVLPAASASQALAIAEQAQRPIDLLLTDMVMPQQSGRALAERILRSRKATKVVYMSGYTDEKVMQDGALGAGDPFVEKPFSEESLLRKVRTALDTPSVSS